MIEDDGWITAYETSFSARSRSCMSSMNADQLRSFRVWFRSDYSAFIDRDGTMHVSAGAPAETLVMRKHSGVERFYRLSEVQDGVVRAAVYLEERCSR